MTADSRPIRAIPVSSRPPAEDAAPEEPTSIASTLTVEDLETIRTTFKIPDFIGLSVPGPEDRVTSVYSDRIALYEEYLRCGLRLPLHPFFLNLLDRYRLAPNQLTPNSIRIVCAYVVLCHYEGVKPGLSLFRAFYKLRCLTGAWWSFAARPRRSWPLGLPSKIRGWKTRFFFAHVPGIRTDWREPDVDANSDGSVMERDKKMFNRLRSGQIPHYKDLLSEHNLIEAELAPVGVMKFSSDKLQAAMAKRALKDGDSSRPAKKARGEGQGKPRPKAGALTAPAAAEEPVREAAVARATGAPSLDMPEAEILGAGAPGVEAPAVELAPEAVGTETVAGEVAASAGEVAASAGEAAMPIDLDPDVAETHESRPAEVVRGSSTPVAESAMGGSEAGSGGVEKGKKEKANNAASRPEVFSGRPRIAGPASEHEPRPVPFLKSLHHAGEALCSVAQVPTAEAVHEVRQMSTGAIVDMLAASAVQTINGFLGLREVIARNSECLGQATGRASKYRRERDGLQQKVIRMEGEAKIREGDLEDKARVSERRADEAEARASSLEADMALLRARAEEQSRELHHAKGQIRAAKKESDAAMERALAAEKVAAEVNSEKAGALSYADEANTRAEEAASRAEEAEGRAKEAEVRAERAEAEAAMAGTKAVEEYKSSTEFEDELLEGSLDAYAQGFDLCKARMIEAFQLAGPELEKIRVAPPADEQRREKDGEDADAGVP